MTSLLSNSRKHDITFHTGGKIDISAHVARLLSLRGGDVVDFVEDKGELMLCVKLRGGRYSGRHQCTVFPTTRKGNGTYRTWSKRLVQKVLRMAGTTETLRCPCGDVITDGDRKYIVIIYRLKL